MAKTTKKSKLSKSDKLLHLFQNRKFSLVFFLLIFSLLGGGIYLLQSSASTGSYARLGGANNCHVSGTIHANSRVSVIQTYANNGPAYGYTTIGSARPVGFGYRHTSALNKRTNIQVWARDGSGNKLFMLTSGYAGPC
jgi:hypothetical protein